jgi:hypothetical protein
MMRTGRLGKSCAKLGATASATHSDVTTARKRRHTNSGRVLATA